MNEYESAEAGLMLWEGVRPTDRPCFGVQLRAIRERVLALDCGDAGEGGRFECRGHGDHEDATRNMGY